MSPKFGHSGLILLIRKPCEERIGAKGGLLNELAPATCYDLSDYLMSDSSKPGNLESAPYIVSCRQLGFDEWLHSWEEVSVSKIRFARAVANEKVAAVAQDPPAFRRDRGGIGKMMKNHRHENHVNTIA